MHGIHHKSGIMFFAEINKNAVSCWNSKKSALKPSKMGEVAQDDVNLIYPSDLNVSFDTKAEKIKKTFFASTEAGRKETHNKSFLFSGFDFRYILLLIPSSSFSG